MKKKFRLLFLCVTACVSALTLFSACDRIGHDHVYTLTVVQPTCTEAGYTLFTCDCGKSYRDNMTDALGHDYVSHEGRQPSCTEAGWAEYRTCSRCDYTEYEELPAHGHSWEDAVYWQIREDVHVRYCTSCREYIAEEHVFDESFICTECYYTKAATAGLEFRPIMQAEEVAGYSVSIGAASGIGCVVIPNTYAGKPVLRIADYAFSGCNQMTAVIIPESVTKIGVNAFADCVNLTGTLKLPNAISDIGMAAFWGCAGLTGELKIPAGVTKVAAFAFYGCTGLTDLTIASGVTYLETGAFMRCTGLKRAEIADSVVGIGEFTFLDCDALEEVRMPAAAIGSVPAANLVLLEITSGEYIRYQGFQNCRKLESVVIADSVKVIGESAFSRCDKLTRIVIPNGVSQIGNAAFENCEALTEVVIGKGVTHIGNGAFAGCYTLESVTYKGSAAEWALIEIDSSNECLLNAARFYDSESSAEGAAVKRRDTYR